MTEREELESAFEAAVEAKKKAKPMKGPDGAQIGDPSEYLAASRRICDLANKIASLEGGLSESQANSYYWALYALAAGTSDAMEYCRSTRLFLDSYMRYRESGVAVGEIERNALSKLVWIGAKRIWKSEVHGLELRGLMQNAIRVAKGPLRDVPSSAPMDPRRVFFCGLTVRLGALEKGDGANRVAIPHEIARYYLELVDLSVDFLSPEDFERRKATPEAVAASHGKLKDFPSTVEKALGFAHRCLKQHQGAGDQLIPSEKLMDFARTNVSRGKWFGLYYGSWLSWCGRRQEARAYFQDVVVANLNEGWAWLYLGRTFKGDVNQQVKCYCRALICPVHDPQVSEGLNRKILAELASLGHPMQNRPEECRQAAQGAERLLCDGMSRIWVEGTVVRKEGQGFAFLKGNGQSVFIPPALVARKALKNGAVIAGIAVKSFDKKKKCASLALSRVVGT